MESVKAVQIDGALFAGRRLGDGDGRAQGVVRGVFERHHDVEPVHAAALEDHHQDFAARALLRARGADQKRRRQAEGEKPEPGGFKKWSGASDS